MVSQFWKNISKHPLPVTVSGTSKTHISNKPIGIFKQHNARALFVDMRT